MKKIIIIILFLLIGVFGSTWLYFKNIVSAENNVEKVFKIIPTDASLIFEFKNEAYFYDIFKDFTLFQAVLGNDNIEHLKALKTIFVDDATISGALLENEFFFSLHPTEKSKADLLIVIPYINKQKESVEEMLNYIKSKYKITQEKIDGQVLNSITFNNKAKFYFFLENSNIIASFNENLIALTLNKKDNDKQQTFTKSSFSEIRNKNSIANLYINYPNLQQLLNNFSRKKDPSETSSLKTFSALSTLNINFQSNAFMFSGITELTDAKDNYAALFLTQEPGKNTLMDILPYDAANYLFYYISDYSKFKPGLAQLFDIRKEQTERSKQMQSISQKHTINIEKEFPLTLGHEFGTIQLASGDKLGLIKTKNINRMALILSAISSEYSGTIRRFDDSNLLYYFLGDPFKSFRRPYYAIIENHLIVCNSSGALNRFLKNYEKQNYLSRTDRNVVFQQYLSNQGNIFYFLHNSNAKSIIRSYLSNTAYKDFRSDEFNWKNIYGLSVQYSADKDKFFTNLYMSKLPEKNVIEFRKDSLGLDTLLK